MRKDVQLGLAIGGVFLAVLIVWGLVISGSHKSAKRGVALETGDKNTSPTDADRGSEIPPAINRPDDHSTSLAVPSTNPVSPERATAETTGPRGTGGNGSTATDSSTATTDKKETNWHALLLADHPEALAGLLPTQTPPPSVTPGPGTSERTADRPAGSLQGSGPAEPDKVFPTTDPSERAGGPAGDATGEKPRGNLRTHTVQRGESFFTISKAVYGDGRFAAQIASANPSVNPGKLRIGTLINLPDASQIRASASAPSHAPAHGPRMTERRPAPASPTSAAPTVDSKREYRVIAGDSLYRISVRLFGSGEEVDHIYELNKATIGADRGKLKLGMLLKLPAAPTATASR